MSLDRQKNLIDNPTLGWPLDHGKRNEGQKEFFVLLTGAVRLQPDCSCGFTAQLPYPPPPSLAELTYEMAEANPLAGRAPAIFLGERQTHLAPADPPTAKRTKCRDAIQYVS